ncbi:MAG: class I SAM-dependent methyltransferase [Clostridia bacterium]|nr:class I SAM-dependent methyltransferase [Clostridia bacterium]
MENQYTALARFYDMLNGVDYVKWADYLEKLIKKYAKSTDIVLELACGTGTLSRIFAQRGYDMISIDNSPEMLGVAQEKCEGMENMPLFLCQNMCELDLYGTIDVALCCLDSINYLTYMTDVRAAFESVSLFMNPGGIFIFDIKTKGEFARLKGVSNGLSMDDGFYFWQYDYDKKSGLCQHNIELFTQGEGGYDRQREVHFQRGYSFEQIDKMLVKAGFDIVGRFKELSVKKAENEEGRVFYVARKV